MSVNLSRMTAVLFRTGQSILNDRLKDLDISSGQMDFLYVITLHEGLTQLELAEFTFVGKSAVTKVVNTLEQRGYIRRESDPSDLRVWRLYLTEQGHRITKRIQETFQELVSMHKKYLTEEEAIQTMKSLEKVLAGLLEEKEKVSRNL